MDATKTETEDDRVDTTVLHTQVLESMRTAKPLVREYSRPSAACKKQDIISTTSIHHVR